MGNISFRKIGMSELKTIMDLFAGVFTVAPWNDDWSDREQLRLYILDLIGQNISLAYGLYEGESLIGLSMGHIRHWYAGTEYHIDEFCIRPDKQGRGMGKRFLQHIENAVRDLGITRIFLQTSNQVPAYHFYQNNGFDELIGHVSFIKQL